MPITRIVGRSDFVPPDEDRHPALARAAYASVILEKVRQVKERYGQPETSEQPIVGILPAVLDSWPTVRTGNWYPATRRPATLEGRIAEIVDQESFLRIAGEEVSKQFAERAKPCFGTLEDSGGQYCSTLYTDSEDDDLDGGRHQEDHPSAELARLLPHLLSQRWPNSCPTGSLPTAGTGSSNRFPPSPMSTC